MKKFNIITGILTVSALVIMAASLDARHKSLPTTPHFSTKPQGKGWRGSGGWGRNSNYQRMYNPQTTATVKGVVKEVKQITPLEGMCYGVHLRIKTDSDVRSVHLGPGWFVERQDIKIQQGDRIEAKGSKIDYRGEPVIIAAEVKIGDDILVLRDENGFPLWAGARRRR